MTSAGIPSVIFIPKMKTHENYKFLILQNNEIFEEYREDSEGNTCHPSRVLRRTHVGRVKIRKTF